MKKAILLIKNFLSLAVLLTFLVSCSSTTSSNPDKFLGQWYCGAAVEGEDYADISSDGGNLIVALGSWKEYSAKNTGVFKDGKIKVSFRFKGETEISYSEEGGQPSIYIFGNKYHKANSSKNSPSSLNNEAVVAIAWAELELAYQNRTDLYKKIVSKAQSFLKNNLEVIHSVNEAATKISSIKVDLKNISSEQIQDFDSAQESLQSSFVMLMTVIERYPDLKTDQEFISLQSQLDGTENRINVSRQKFKSAQTRTSTSK
jgi:hypothetical protein